MKIIVLLALTFCLAVANAAPNLDAPARTAHDALRQTSYFALGGVGYAGVTSDAELAYRELKRDPNAVAAFVALLDDDAATKAGQLYGLLGLKEAGDARFEARLPEFLADDSTVTQFSGCLMMPVKVSEIARQIEGRGAAKTSASSNS